MAIPDIEYFESAAKFRAWLKKHHAKAGEVRVGYIKAGLGRSMTWAESVDEALCFGWIDGVRKRIDAERYFIRFTPRKRTSTWSTVNIRKFAALEAAGRMTEAGRAAFAARSEAKSRTYSFEQSDVKLDATRLELFKKEKKAWAFFMAQPPGYRKKALWWIVSAKKDETKDARLAKVMGASANGERLE